MKYGIVLVVELSNLVCKIDAFLYCEMYSNAINII